MSERLPQLALQQLQNAPERLAKMRALVGFDGFVDTILHVVDQRESATKFTRLTRMRDFAERMKAAAGLSANFEFVTQMVKLGGNGPIMAQALGSYGLPVRYIGNLGAPHLHPVFADFALRVDVCSIAEPGYTDAVEFDDGKLMFGKHDSLREINWATLTRLLPEADLRRNLSDASCIALVNWTMLPFMSAIFQKLLTRIAPALTGKKRLLFFDLADPAKRPRKDIAQVLRMISAFQAYFKVVLGLNLQESRQVGKVLGLKAPSEDFDAVTRHAARIQDKLQIETVVIHPMHFAAAADASGATYVCGPVTAKPKLTTGAGDHFNAGFCIGKLTGGDLATCLQVGVATSGYYVRNAKSPRLEDLKRFLQTL